MTGIHLIGTLISSSRWLVMRTDCVHSDVDGFIISSGQLLRSFWVIWAVVE